MQIKELRINNFGKFQDRTITFREGLNLIYGENEAGKTTLHTFIKGMLFGIEKLRGKASKEDAYLKYQPWVNPNYYSGSMDFTVSGRDYRVIRSFEKNNKNLSLLDLNTGRELAVSQEELTALYGGLTESGFRNTISIEQLKVRTGQELADEVRNYITNLSLSKSNEVDIKEALKFLQDKRKELEGFQYPAKLAALEKEIEEYLGIEKKAEELAGELKEAEEEENRRSRQLEKEGNREYLGEFASENELAEYLEYYPIISEKYLSLKELQKQQEELLQKLSFLNNELEQKKEADSGAIRRQLDELDKIHYDMDRAGKEKEILTGENQVILQKARNKMMYLLVIPFLICAAGILLNTILNPGDGKGVINLLILLLSGMSVIGFLLSNKKISQKHRDDKLALRQWEELIRNLKLKENTILKAAGAENIPALRFLYEDALRKEMETEHYKKQKKDLKGQLEVLKERYGGFEGEILNYIRRAASLLPGEDITVQGISDAGMKVLEEQIRMKKQMFLDRRESAKKELDELRLKKEKIKWELKLLEENEDKLIQTQDIYKELRNKQKKAEEELGAIKLAAETINDLSVDIHDSFGQELNKLVSCLAGEITEGKYRDIKVDEKLSVKVNQNNNLILLDKLSAGTIEQMYFALRVAISGLIYNGEDMPLLIDDCFALYDDNRTRAALKFLSCKMENQVLLFTCHSREMRLLEEENIEYHFIDLT